MGAVLHLVQREGAWAGWGPPSPLLAVPNVTAHPSTASVPTTVLLYDGPFLCGFNVAIKGVKGTECSLNGYYLTLHHYNLTLKKHSGVTLLPLHQSLANSISFGSYGTLNS